MMILLLLGLVITKKNLLQIWLVIFLNYKNLRLMEYKHFFYLLRLKEYIERLFLALLLTMTHFIHFLFKFLVQIGVQLKMRIEKANSHILRVKYLNSSMA